jgi:hypothetical protein
MGLRRGRFVAVESYAAHDPAEALRRAWLTGDLFGTGVGAMLALSFDPVTVESLQALVLVVPNQALTKSVVG